MLSYADLSIGSLQERRYCFGNRIFQAFHAYSDLFVSHDIGIHVICRVGGQAVGRVFHGTAEKMDIQKFITVNSVFLQVVSI